MESCKKDFLCTLHVLRTICFDPEERKPLHCLYIQPTQYGHSVNTDTFYGPLSVENIPVEGRKAL